MTESVVDKPSALKLVLKVGAPYTPSDADSQSEAVDSDSEKKTRQLKRKHQQSEGSDHQEKKVLWSIVMYNVDGFASVFHSCIIDVMMYIYYDQFC